MQDIKLSIIEYEESCAGVQKRIHELNAAIAQCKESKRDSSIKELVSRRSAMYIELWDMEFCLRSMREYVHATSGPEVTRQVG